MQLLDLLTNPQPIWCKDLLVMVVISQEVVEVVVDHTVMMLELVDLVVVETVVILVEETQDLQLRGAHLSTGGGGGGGGSPIPVLLVDLDCRVS